MTRSCRIRLRAYQKGAACERADYHDVIAFSANKNIQSNLYAQQLHVCARQNGALLPPTSCPCAPRPHLRPQAPRLSPTRTRSRGTRTASRDLAHAFATSSTASAHRASVSPRRFDCLRARRRSSQKHSDCPPRTSSTCLRALPLRPQTPTRCARAVEAPLAIANTVCGGTPSARTAVNAMRGGGRTRPATVNAMSGGGSTSSATVNTVSGGSRSAPATVREASEALGLPRRTRAPIARAPELTPGRCLSRPNRTRTERRYARSDQSLRAS